MTASPLPPCLPTAAGGQDEGSAVFISNLQWWTTDAELEQLCAAYGQVRLGLGKGARRATCLCAATQ